MKRERRTICLLAASLAPLVALSFSPHKGEAEVEHQYAPLREVKLELKDFSFSTLEGATLNLREAARGKRLILVTYFAAWCHNSNYDVETINELYTKYREPGLAVVGVCEYSSPEELRGFIERHKPTYPICLEGGDQIKDRSATTHYHYRKQAGDQRRWGTPFSILISADEMREQGETITKRAHAAAGELIKAEAEEFIRQQLSISNSSSRVASHKLRAGNQPRSSEH